MSAEEGCQMRVQQAPSERPRPVPRRLLRVLWGQRTGEVAGVVEVAQ